MSSLSHSPVEGTIELPSQVWAARALSIVVLGALASATFVVDLTMGHYVDAFPFYLGIVGLATWWFGRVGGFTTMMFVVGFTLVSAFLEVGVKSGAWIPALNSGARFAMMFGFVYLLDWRLRAFRGKHVRAMDGAGFKRVVCSCCARIAAPDGAWLEPPDFEKNSDSNHTILKVCAHCARERYLHS